MPQHVVIVCGYGCHLTPELEKYLGRVSKFVNSEKPNLVILSGGFTQRKTSPGVSEAQLMHDYLSQRVWHTPFFLDSSSYTTRDNIKNSVKILREFNITDSNVTVFCEATRALKVDLLVRHFLGRRVNIETSNWEQMSPNRQIVATLYDWAAIKFPLLAKYFYNQRLKRAERI